MKRIGIIRIQTLIKALMVFYSSLHQSRILTVDEIVQVIGGKKANAYNYQRFLRTIIAACNLDNEEMEKQRR